MHPLTYAEQIAYSSKEVLLFTNMMAHDFRNMPGVYLEAGVAAGAQIIAMLDAAPDKEIWAFDSFEGIPLASNRDDQLPGLHYLTKAEQKALPDPGKQALISSGATVVSLNDFLQHITNAFGKIPENLWTEVGWFENTVKHFNKSIALLRLDGDLYNSTFVCLQHLFPLVVNGGLVIIDDYYLLGCRDACKEYFELIGYEPDYKFLEGDGYTVAYFTK